MIRNIIKGYSTILVTCGKILLLFALCAAAGFIIVYPLWKCAVSFPQIYTAVVLCVLAAIIGAAVFFKLRAWLTFPGTDRKKRIRRLWIGVAKAAVIAAGIVSFVFAVLAGSRLAGIGILILVILVYGVLAFGLRRDAE